MAMLAPVHVENFGRLYGSNQPISAHFTAFNSSDQLQRKRSSIFQEALPSFLVVVLGELHHLSFLINISLAKPTGKVTRTTELLTRSL
jgi:hypothetical protein